MTSFRNFLPEQYRQTNSLEINHNYLSQQFADHDAILAKIREVVIRETSRWAPRSTPSKRHSPASAERATPLASAAAQMRCS